MPGSDHVPCVCASRHLIVPLHGTRVHATLSGDRPHPDCRRWRCRRRWRGGSARGRTLRGGSCTVPGTDELVPQPYQVGKIRHLPEPVGQESDTKIVTVGHGRCAGGDELCRFLGHARRPAPVTARLCLPRPSPRVAHLVVGPGTGARAGSARGEAGGPPAPGGAARPAPGASPCASTATLSWRVCTRWRPRPHGSGPHGAHL